MIFKFIVESSYEVDLTKIETINSLSDKIEGYFADKNYGSELDTVIVSVICVSPQFDFFSVIRKPKYITKKQTYINVDGVEITYGKMIQYDIKLNFDEFMTGNNISRNNSVITELLQSVSVFETFRSKLQRFDFSKFMNDLEKFLKRNVLKNE